ncbi:phosphatidylinositol 3-and 4-kinase domain-containing protein [Cyclospora cayetanensis]|uniref:Phosphatidylinositol 3-and 4-kinase domain-containing protein n=1 Tax=Cyclospora cayetanensis TaxID=88456 RepID=A0A1D3CXV5_9EIME|nr:phosphatidylinositol 3-and 4-kinase domain-containing protein [Cyclospora cayetanensis]
MTDAEDAAAVVLQGASLSLIAAAAQRLQASSALLAAAETSAAFEAAARWPLRTARALLQQETQHSAGAAAAPLWRLLLLLLQQQVVRCLRSSQICGDTVSCTGSFAASPEALQKSPQSMPQRREQQKPSQQLQRQQLQQRLPAIGLILLQALRVDPGRALEGALIADFCGQQTEQLHTQGGCRSPCSSGATDDGACTFRQLSFALQIDSAANVEGDPLAAKARRLRVRDVHGAFAL